MEQKTPFWKIILRILIPCLCIVAIIGYDAYVKEWALNALDSRIYKPVIGDLIGFILVKNQGMAWGMFQGKQWLFIVLTPIAVGLITFLYVRTPYEKKYIPIRIAEVMLIGGAIGNLLDRVFRGELFRGEVVDMIYVKIINFPVFNVADCFVSVGFILLMILILFVYKDEDFEKVISLKLFSKKVEE